MSQVTAVDWFVEQLPIRILNMYREEINQARILEKEQIINAANLTRDQRWFDAKLYNNCGEQYYNEAFNK